MVASNYITQKMVNTYLQQHENHAAEFVTSFKFKDVLKLYMNKCTYEILPMETYKSLTGKMGRPEREFKTNDGFVLVYFTTKNKSKLILFYFDRHRRLIKVRDIKGNLYAEAAIDTSNKHKTFLVQYIEK